MKLVLRWFGHGVDHVPIKYIGQIPGVSGVATSIMDIPAGDVWEKEDVQRLKNECEAAGLSAEVIESVNIHEDIKLGLPSREHYIQNYIKTIEHLAEIGVKVICYNFMPVLDWVRSALFYDLPDGSNSMFYDDDVVMNTTPEKLAAMYNAESEKYAMVGWEPERLKKVNDTIALYENMTEEKYLSNIKYFLDAIIPYCERYDIKMAIHPDDPPWPVFGLPRLVVNKENIAKILSLNSSVYNGLTLCTGSLGANPDNDIPAIIREFPGRVHFAHVRNIKFISQKSFYECAHYTACGTLDIFEILKALYETGFEGYVRPDHGRMIFGEVGRAGYGLYDRALGAQYILGIWEALEKLNAGGNK